MLPVATSTAIVPIQTNLVATPLPGNFAARAPISAVPPSNSNHNIGNNSQGNGGAVAPVAQALATLPVSAPLGTLIAASYSSSSASLAPISIFAAQAMAQGESADGFLAVYDEMVALSEVKYKPSNANVPHKEPADVFSKIVTQERQQIMVLVANIAQRQLPSEQVQAVIAAPKAMTPKNINSSSKKENIQVASDKFLQTISAYKAASTRNSDLDMPPVEAITG